MSPSCMTVKGGGGGERREGGKAGGEIDRERERERERERIISQYVIVHEHKLTHQS